MTSPPDRTDIPAAALQHLIDELETYRSPRRIPTRRVIVYAIADFLGFAVLAGAVAYGVFFHLIGEIPMAIMLISFLIFLSRGVFLLRHRTRLAEASPTEDPFAHERTRYVGFIVATAALFFIQFAPTEYTENSNATWFVGALISVIPAMAMIRDWDRKFIRLKAAQGR